MSKYNWGALSPVGILDAIRATYQFDVEIIATSLEGKKVKHTVRVMAFSKQAARTKAMRIGSKRFPSCGIEVPWYNVLRVDYL